MPGSFLVNPWVWVAGLTLLCGTAASAEAPAPLTPVRFELVSKGESRPAPVAWSGSLVLRPPTAGAAPIRLAVSPQGIASTALAAGSGWEVSAEVPGFWARRYTLEVGRNPTSQRIDLWPMGKISGTVRFAKPGARLPASLSVGTLAAPKYLHRPEAPPGLLDCPIDPKGGWTCALPAAEYDLVVSAEGFIPKYLWNVRVPAGKTLPLGELELAAGASVAGWVAVEAGSLDPATCVARLEPLLAPGASTADAARVRRTAAEQKVRADGFFQLAGLAPGNYGLEVRHAGFAPARVSPLTVRPGVATFLRDPLLLERPLDLDFTILPPLDALGQPWTLKLYRGAEGAAFRGAPAFARTVDSQGHASVPRQSPGRFWVTVADSRGNRLYSNRNLRIDGPGDAQQTIELRLVTVRGSLTLGREPLAATLWFGGRNGAPSVQMEADAEGRFQGLLPELRLWTVDVEATDPRLATQARVEVAADSAHKATLEIALPDNRISGRVVDEQGRPAGGAEVFYLSGNGVFRSEADGEGRFSARALPAGALAVSAEGARGGPLAGWTSETAQLSLADGQEAGPIELRLRKTKTLTGKVVSPFGPVAGATVAVLPHGREGGGRATTDPAGGWSVTIPERTESATVVVSAPGSGLKALWDPLESTCRHASLSIL